MHNLIISGTETLITKTDRDVKRFQKLINKRPMPLSLLCICEADKWNFQVVEGDGYEEISVAEISYMDSAGITHVVSSSGGDLYVIRIFIQVDGKVLVVYQEKKMSHQNIVVGDIKTLVRLQRSCPYFLRQLT